MRVQLTMPVYLFRLKSALYFKPVFGMAFCGRDFMRIGILTGGGDCPGLNAVVRAIVRRSVMEHGSEVVGFLEGWRGPMEGMVMPLTLQGTGGLIPAAGPFCEPPALIRSKPSADRKKLPSKWKSIASMR